MRQLTFIEPGRMEWRKVADPVIEASGDALVRPIAVATCDLDAGIVSGRAPVPGPFPFGHECVADVIETGSGVKGFKAGDRVVVPFQIACGECERCSRGLTSSCTSVARGSAFGMGAIGRNWPAGALSDLVRVPFADQMLVRVPDGLDAASIASASDNIPDAWRTVAPQLEQRPGVPVLIVGGGAAGIPFYAIEIALALGAERVDYVDGDPARLELAQSMGASVLAGPAPRKLGPYPITVDASADPAGLLCAVRSTEAGGTCTSIGIYFQNEVPLPLLEMYTNGITFITGRVSARPLIPAILELAAAGRIHPERVTDRVVQWDQAAEALATLHTKTVIVR